MPLTRRALCALPPLLALPFVMARPAFAGSGPQSFAPLVKRVMPSVVNIGVTETVGGGDPFANLPPELQRQFRERFRLRKQQVTGAGSGFIIDADGYIVTNNHVVGNADTIVVVLSDGTELPAKLVGTDELTDVALIKVEAKGKLPAVTWGDSKALEVGDWVIAAGNPFGLGGSVTAGIVSARGRDLGAGPFDDFIQIDAPINPGNSGGPLFNADGEVVGVNSQIYSPTGGSVGIGFAIPADLVNRVVGELRTRGRIDRGWLGVSVQDVAASPRGPAGIGIAAVDRAGPAAKAGLRAGDIVLALNGQAVDSARALIKGIALTPPGQSVQVSLRRQGRTMDIPVVVGQRPKLQEEN
jgi:serine protease Do